MGLFSHILGLTKTLPTDDPLKDPCMLVQEKLDCSPHTHKRLTANMSLVASTRLSLRDVTFKNTSPRAPSSSIVIIQVHAVYVCNYLYVIYIYICMCRYVQELYVLHVNK